MSTDFVFSTDSTVSRDSVDSSYHKTSEFFPCPHIKTIKHKTRLNCFKCGVCLHDSAKAYKTQKMKFGAYFDPSKFYSSSLKQRIPKIVIDPESEFYKSRNFLLDFVLETCDKLKLTVNTTHLAIMFMDFVLSKVSTIPSKLYQVYAATSVMLAAKSIELDERIPFISKLKRYSNLVTVQSKEFSQAEQIILKELNWNLQCVTTIDVMEYYLSQGVVFSTDYFTDDASSNSSFNEDNALKEKSNMNDTTPSALSTKSANTNKYSAQKNDENKDFTAALNNLSIGEKENNGATLGGSNTSTNNLKKKILVSDLADSRIYVIVQKIEKDYLRLSNLIMRDYRFNDFDIKILSSASICFLRKMNGISPAWNKQLTSISNNLVSETMFQDCLSILENKFRTTFMPLVSNNNNNNSTKRPSVLSTNNSNMLLRDSENQNKVGSSSTTPTKYMFRNNLSTHTSNNKVNESSSYKVMTKPLQFSHTNSNIIENSQPTQFSVHNAVSSNSALGNKNSSYTNYQYNNSYLSSQNIHHHQNGISNQQNSQNIYPSSNNSTSANISSNTSYLRNGQSQYQPSSYIGLVRFGSNII